MKKTISQAVPPPPSPATPDVAVTDAPDALAVGDAQTRVVTTESHSVGGPDDPSLPPRVAITNNTNTE
jgi:hypothetical protein